MGRPAPTKDTQSGLTKNETLIYPSDLQSITNENGVPYYISIYTYTYKAGSYLTPAEQQTAAGALVGFATGVAVLGLPGGLFGSVVGGTGGYLTSDTSVSAPRGYSAALQLPTKINDVQTLTWSQESLKAIVDFVGVTRIIDAVRAPQGLVVNPALFMLFHHPNFKSYDMSWQFVANNESEAETIAKIINFFKYESSPRRLEGFSILSMEYPSIFQMKFYPEDKFTFKMKPAVVEAVAVDYTGGGFPAFYKNGAPIQVNLTVRFREIEIWEKSTWNESATAIGNAATAFSNDLDQGL